MAGLQHLIAELLGGVALGESEPAATRHCLRFTPDRYDLAGAETSQNRFNTDL
jgi:hypothetical protein